ncbi:histidine-containing phosphotransfer factor 5, partial [Prunus dulcis]
KELGQEFKELVSSLQDQGILDEQFDQMKAVQNERNPCFVANLITTFLGDVENILAQLSTYLSAEDPDEVNYPQVATLALTLKGSSSRWNAQSMKMRSKGAICRERACENISSLLNLLSFITELTMEYN